MIHFKCLHILPICLIALSLVCTAASDRAGENEEWLKKETERQIEGCKIESDSGMLLHAPDGIANYKGMWTREYYFVVTYAGEFISDENLKATIQHILDRQRMDGCIPLRVAVDGTPTYKTGGGKKPMSDHALDNAPFLALTVCEYVRRTGDCDFFQANGIHDSVNEDYSQVVPDYVSSATNLYAASRWLSPKR